jgi:hypothetical protein
MWRLKSFFDWRFSFSALTFKTIGSLLNFRRANFSSDGQYAVK